MAMQKKMKIWFKVMLALASSTTLQAEEAATAMGNTAATVLSQPFAMSAPQWPDSMVESGTPDELADDIVFNSLQLPNSQLRDMLARRETRKQIGFTFSGIPYSPLTVSLNDTYREFALASVLRSTEVRFSETDLRSGFMDAKGQQSIFLDVLLSSPDLKSLPKSYFSLTIEHN